MSCKYAEIVMLRVIVKCTYLYVHRIKCLCPGSVSLGSSSLSENTNAWSVKVLKDLVYKAAQVGGLEFIKTIFTTSAGKVVFSNYKDSPTLPEDVARANGHTTLADYLQDMNNR